MVALLMLLALAASVAVEAGPAEALAPQTAPSAAVSVVHGSASAHESQVIRSAEATLAHGAGPARGHAESCTASAEGSARCGLSNSPASSFPSWYNVTSSTGAIPATEAASIAWDPTWLNGVVVYFGGCEITGMCPDNYTWVYDGFAWYNETGSIGPAPPAMDGQSMDWDPMWGGIVLAGGAEANGLPVAGTWMFSAGTWQNITSTVGGLGSSPPSVFGAMAWDPASQALLFVGGCTDSTCVSVWDGAWTLAGHGVWSSATAYGFLYGESLAFDAADHELIAFGGSLSSGAILNSTWAFSNGGWTNLTASSVGCFFLCNLYPQGRAFASMTWDSQTNSILLFGGLNTTNSLLSDSWSFSGNSWFPFVTTGSFAPPAGELNAMPVNSSGFAPVLVGGFCSGSGDTYTLDIPPNPVVSSVSTNPADVGATVSVTVNGSAGYGSGPWLFLDGNFGNSQIASSQVFGVNATTPWTFTEGVLSYPAPGTYPMVVTVSDFFYVNATAHYNLTVVAGTSVIVAGPLNGEAGHPLPFTASVTLGVTPYTYNWSFGDGGTSSAVAPSHTYAIAGAYGASLTISDAGGGRTVANFTVDIIAGVVAHASANVTATDAGLPISFTGSASAGSGPYSLYSWHFGDGGTSAQASAMHTYTAAGTYHVALNVTDSLGFVGTTTLTVTVNALPTAAAVVATPYSSSPGAAVSLSVAAQGGTAPFTYTWTFGDGSSGTGPTPTHTYSTAGTFTVSVVVTDALGQKVTSHGTVTVKSASSVSGFALTSGTGLYVLIGILAVILVVVASVLLMRRGRRPSSVQNAPPPGATDPAPPPPGASP